MSPRTRPIALACTALFAFAQLSPAAGAGEFATEARPAASPATNETPRFSRSAARQARAQGSEWLQQNQNPDGGWGSGSWGSRSAQAASDVATTSLSVLALLRDGGSDGAHREAIEKGVRFVVRNVESTPAEGPRLQGPDGTQPQRKLGRNVDTHFASLLFGEVSGRMPPELDARVQVAYDVVLSKVVAAQREDGSFDSDGWAPVLSSSVAAQGLSRAQALGKAVAPEALARSDAYQQKLVDETTGEFDASSGAGVELYAAASTLRSNSEAAKRAPTAADRERAEAAADAGVRAVRSAPAQLAAGFGSVGGEEMLSYMMISDSLVEAGGDTWTQWEQHIGDNLLSTQNGDGSWSGHHCITSTTFVTAAAILTLAAGDAYAQTQASIR